MVGAALAGERVDRALAILTGITRSEASALVREGKVRVGGAVQTTPSGRVGQGDVLEATVDGSRGTGGPEPDAEVAVGVVHSDAAIIVVDKPTGLVVHPGAGNAGATVVNGLLARFPDLGALTPGDPARPGVVHRLDKGTSGLMVVARSEASYTCLVAQMKARRVARSYLALVHGELRAPGAVDAPVGRSARSRTSMAVSASGREAMTHYSPVRNYGGAFDTTLVECTLETGRTHQIRVHMAAIGHPVVGDDRYGDRRQAASPHPGRMFLHAHKLSFTHPESGENVTFESPLPKELEAYLARLD